MTWLEKARQRKTELDTKLHRLDCLENFIATPDWSELEMNSSIKAGTIVRFGALRYTARTDHTRTLTRSPLNLIYWQVEGG